MVHVVHLGVLLVVDVGEHGLHVLEGHHVVVVGIELVEVLVGKLLPHLLHPLFAWLEFGRHRQPLVGTALSDSPLLPLLGSLIESLVASTRPHSSVL